jgi:hypothetical protein
MTCGEIDIVYDENQGGRDQGGGKPRPYPATMERAKPDRGPAEAQPLSPPWQLLAIKPCTM